MVAVLLGLEDAPLTAGEQRAADMTVSRLGGRAAWPGSDRPAPRCAHCDRPLPLVAQVYAPIGASPYHRTLYVFGCPAADCANRADAWRCLRAQSRVTAAETAADMTAPPVVGAAAADWLDAADDWGDDDEDDEDADSVGSGQLPASLQQLALDADNANVAAAGQAAPAATAELEPSTEESVSAEPVAPPSCDLRALLTAPPPPLVGPVTFVATHLSVVEEPRPQAAPSHHELELLRAYQSREGVNLAQLSAPAADAGHTGAESYERTLPAHGDRLLHKLKQRLALWPDQVLRYCRDGGAPLPLLPLPPPPPCRHCGGPAVFELQLLPTLVSRLRTDAGSGGDGERGLLEFGTVLVFTCRDSCWADGDLDRVEIVVVQAEL